MDPLAKLLNPPQLEAVRHGEGPLLILAGAGSGKTRVLTHRIAHLLRERMARAGEIMAVTFTNKAAGELKERVEKLVGPEAERLWVATFHAAGARILRREADALKLTRSFAIYDDGDQLAEAKRVISDLGMEVGTARQHLARIDRWKNAGLLPGEVQVADYDVPGKTALKVYARYQAALQASNAVDFGDLIVRVLELFKLRPDILSYYSGRFRFILVDEFQDTNPAQYQLLRLLSGTHGNLCVVGDDDQSIYRWRGAEVENILDFPKHFKGTRVVKLEQNYRSSGRILGAAHAIIARNERRAEKKLWTAASDGDKVRVVVAEDERDEATRIAAELYAENARGTPYDEMAVFYRANAQSRSLEDQLRARRVPYRVVRGRSFYDRAEVKDIAAYLRLCVNPRSDGDLLRVINTPPRGIGDTTVEALRRSAGRQGLSLWEALSSMERDTELASNARTKLSPFRSLIEKLRAAVANDGAAAPAIERVMEETGYADRLRVEGEEGEDRLDNLHELVGAARDFDATWAEARALASSEAGAGPGSGSTAVPDAGAGPGSPSTAVPEAGAGPGSKSTAIPDGVSSSGAADRAPGAASAAGANLAGAPVRGPAVPTPNSLTQTRAQYLKAMAAQRQAELIPREAAPDDAGARRGASASSLDSFASAAGRGLAPGGIAKGGLAPGALGSSADSSEHPFGDRPSPSAALAAAAPDLDGDDREGLADTPLLGFLEQLALVGDADAADGGDRVALMTLHAAKGLEFDAVWLTGCEERVFPSSRALGMTGPMASGEEDPDELAEERRLCYVGMTRARKKLTLTLARCRSLYGELRFNPPSRFVRELPPELVSGLEFLSAAEPRRLGAVDPRRGGLGQGPQRGDVIYDYDYDQRPIESEPALVKRPASGLSSMPARNKARFESRIEPSARPAPRPLPPGAEGLAPGRRVRHPSFGVGTIEEVDGLGANFKLTVRFPPGVGLKKVLARFVEPL